MQAVRFSETSEIFYQTSRSHIAECFYILLTVHHVMIIGKWPTWRTNSFLYIYL